MFRDPIRQFADRLAETGVPTHCHEMPGMFHVFQILMPWAEASRTVYRHVGTFVEDRISGQPPFPRGLLDEQWSEGWAPFGLGAPLHTRRAPAAATPKAGRP